MLNKNKKIYQGFVEQHLWMLLIEIHESPIDQTTRIIESSHPQPISTKRRSTVALVDFVHELCQQQFL